MALNTYIFISIICVIVFALSKKKAHEFELLLIILLIEFLFLTYFAIISTNYSYIKISTKAQDYVTYQIFEIVLLPMLVLLTISYTSFLKSAFAKCLLGLTLVGVLCSIEYSLLRLIIIEYKGWHFFYSITAYSLIFILIQTAKHWFRKILINEGMIKHDSS